MKQIALNLKNGIISVETVPTPTLKKGGVLVKNHYSVISAGTESGLIELADKSLIGKARERPDLAKKVIDKAKKDGPISAFQQAMGRLEKMEPLGYSCAGMVIAVSEELNEFKIGDRVACAGAGYANHAEVIYVPKNLCVKIPESVDFKDAAFTTIGAIALQGIRNADAKIGENIVVIGLGLIGLITIQILKASGCRVFGIDIDESKIKHAKELGADYAFNRNAPNIEESIRQFSRGIGPDATIITAATKSNDPIEFAGNITRERGKVVIVGLVGMNIPREQYYKKEIELRISRSYGPGRYDRSYEEHGNDYPIAYVRWTENQNMQAFLDIISMQKISMTPIITHEFPIEEATIAYEIIEQKKPYLGMIIKYDTNKNQLEKIKLKSAPQEATKIITPTVGVIGAGIFATSTLLPNLKKIRNIKLKGISAATGISCKSIAKKYDFEYCTSNYHQIIEDQDINSLIVAARNSLHAPIVIEALENGKNVLVEKPLALNEDELRKIIRAQNNSNSILMIGFNRRYSELGIKLENFFKDRKQPMIALYRVNAEKIPKDHWIYEDSEGGNRIITECCHFIDFLHYIIGSKPKSVNATKIETGVASKEDIENASITIAYEDGSIATLIYTTHGDKSTSKEYAEFFADEMTGIIRDFKYLELNSKGKRKKYEKRISTEKGHRNELIKFFDRIEKGKSEYDFESNIDTTLLTYMIIKSIKTKTLVKIKND